MTLENFPHTPAHFNEFEEIELQWFETIKAIYDAN